MEAEIREIIEQKLPEHVGRVLRQRLEQAERDKAALDQQKRDADILRREVGELRELKHTAESIAAAEKKLAEREGAVTKRELLAELNEFKVKAAEQRAADVFKLAETAFRNPRLVYATSENRSVPVPSMGHVAPVYESSSTTIEEQ